MLVCVIPQVFFYLRLYNIIGYIDADDLLNPKSELTDNIWWNDFQSIWNIIAACMYQM